MHQTLNLLRRTATNPVVRVIAVSLLQAAATRLQQPSASAANPARCGTPGCAPR
ncbi:hypothetical protein [Streptomyces sp. GQFP]|uniref:hypothetical protein n=1 Tax=Streptomyces sp. GQFP TaxID=2907545 RepID=UPI001F2E16AC|nr:hypothetical protein [Streptomyces sp. GQFP]UIX32299.1 hypothetical protein LUX31_20875 [Streptomyces sp. GQFP]